MSHYETLGVKPDADAAEIKRAYRKRAERAHPDKKEPERASALNLGYVYTSGI